MNSQLIARHYGALLRRLGITVASCSATGTVYNAHNAADELCWVGSRAGSCSTRPGGATTYSYDGNGPVFANRNRKLPIFGNRLSIRRRAG